VCPSGASCSGGSICEECVPFFGCFPSIPTQQ
jgi:hypothetical protein